MPAVIGAAILTEIGATTLAASTTAATVVGYAVISGGFLALQQVVEALTPAQKRSDAQVTVRQAIPPRRGGHGRDKLGGAIFFLDVQGGVLTRGVVHFAGACPSSASSGSATSAPASPRRTAGSFPIGSTRARSPSNPISAPTTKPSPWRCRATATGRPPPG